MELAEELGLDVKTVVFDRHGANKSALRFFPNGLYINEESTKDGKKGYLLLTSKQLNADYQRDPVYNGAA